MENNDIDLYARINRCEYAIDKKFSDGVKFILNKMIRKDPEMRYSAYDLMNDSWVISGPLITGKSYFSNSNIKVILSKSLVGLHQINDNNKRPGTTANQLSSRFGRKMVISSSDKIASMTQYKGFGNLGYKPDIEEKESDNKSISVRLKAQLSNNDQIETNSEAFERATKEANPGKSYFKSSFKSSLNRYANSNKALKQIKFQEVTSEDSYCFNKITKRYCKFPKNNKFS